MSDKWCLDRAQLYRRDASENLRVESFVFSSSTFSSMELTTTNNKCSSSSSSSFFQSSNVSTNNIREKCFRTSCFSPFFIFCICVTAVKTQKSFCPRLLACLSSRPRGSILI